ncbi:DUF4157 domain-containing protein [Streptomyces sp. NPDC049906]|uniref:eCIS core domain-containing protein n=1 Tax=Streptomyces sp. NPDC049906 TaxID=3155656 RepID=UPI00342120A6
MSAQRLLALQATVGNAAVVQLLRRAGRAGQGGHEDRHQHGAGCGHQQAEQAAVQRSAVHRVLRSGGRPLDAATRSDMESRLGADFANVRIHDDSAARASAAEIGARAYTSGNHIVIGNGGADRHTLAHELTHVIQQRQGPVAGTDNGAGLKVSDPSDRYEREAEANATRVLAGGPAVLQGSGQHVPAADAEAVQRVTMQDEPAVLSSFTPSKAGTSALHGVPIQRPTKVTGRIRRTGTAGRPGAPNPLAVTSLHAQYRQAVAAGQATGSLAEAEVWAELFGGAGYDRGHVMGLEVGGLDVSENIVPQWSLNQQSGAWRKIEKDMTAASNGDDVEFNVTYASATGHYQTVMVPKEISARVTSRATGQSGSLTWDNGPDDNDLFRAGVSPDDRRSAFNETKAKLGLATGSVLTEAQMDEFALKVITYPKALERSYRDYERAHTSGVPQKPSQLAVYWDEYTKSDVPKKNRTKFIQELVNAKLVAKGQGSYQLLQ